MCSQHQLEIDIPPDLPEVYADPRRIGQVITNLVENACKYSNPGTLIHLSAQRLDDRVSIAVSDQGIGIPPAERERVFEAFHQGGNRPDMQTRGAGLGLAIARGLVEAHGGSITVQNRQGPGTLIEFTLPILLSDEQ